MTWLVLLLAFALLAVPGATGSLFDSAPMSTATKALVAAVATLGVAAWVFGIKRLPARTSIALGAFLAVKLLLFGADVPAGWQTQVYMDGRSEPSSFFWHYGQHSSRVDTAIDFDGPGFGLHFLNDLPYNTGVYAEGRREDLLPFRAVWRGVVRAPAGSIVTGSASGRGNIDIRVGAEAVLRTDHPENAPFDIRVGDAGSVDVVVAYDKPAQTSPFVRVTWPGAVAPDVSPPDAEFSGWPGQALRAKATSVLVAGGVAWFGVAVILAGWRGRGTLDPTRLIGGLAVVIGFAIVAVGAVALSDRYAGQTYFMSSGNDPIVYEGSARDIMANGPLMLSGKPLGRADPYFHYPLYPYVVALFHWVIGEDAAAVMFGNGLLVALTIPLLWGLGWHQLDRWSAVAAISVATWLTARYALPYAQEVFTDNVFLPLVLASLIAGTRAMQTDRRGAWLVTGALIAFGAAARPSLLTFLPFLLLAIAWWGWHRADWPWALRACLLTFGGFALGVAPFAIRNYYVSGQVVMLVNSWVGLAVFLVPPGESYAFLYSGRALTLLESVTEAVTLAAQHPARTIGLEVRKLFFALGLTNLGPGQQLVPLFLVTSVAGLVALAWRRVATSTAVVTGAFAASHITAMIMAAPWTYGYKSILPLQAVFLFWAGFLLSGARRTPSE